MNEEILPKSSYIEGKLKQFCGIMQKNVKPEKTIEALRNQQAQC